MLKRLGLEVYHVSLIRDEVKNKWSYTSAPPTHLHGVERDNFTFYVILTVM
jgi:hypothetical protein